MNNSFCIPESFNMNITHKLFDYKKNIMNSQRENSNSNNNNNNNIYLTCFYIHN